MTTRSNTLGLDIHSSHPLILDSLKEVNSNLHELGPNCRLVGDISLDLAGQLESGLEESLPLIKWVMEGFSLKMDLEGNKQLVDNLTKYLALSYKDKDRKLCSFIYLLRNCNVNLDLKSPSDVDAFLRKLGILTIINDTTTLKKALTFDKQPQESLTGILSDLIKLLTPFVADEIQLRISIPFLEMSVKIKGDPLHSLL